MARLAAAVTALLLSQVAGPAIAATPLFPLAAGHQWKLVGGGVTRTVAVARARGGLVLRGFPGLPETGVRAVGTRIDARERTAWTPFLRLGAPTGTSYRVGLAALLWRDAIVTVASRRFVVTDADGRAHSGCVRLTVRLPKPVVDTGVEELVFAPGVGLVRVTEQTFAGPRQLLLTTGTAPTR